MQQPCFLSPGLHEDFCDGRCVGSQSHSATACLVSSMLRRRGAEVSSRPVARKRSTWLGVLLVLVGLSPFCFDVFFMLVTLVGLKQIAGPWSSMELLRKVGILEDNGLPDCLGKSTGKVLAAFLGLRVWNDSGNLKVSVLVITNLIMGSFKLFEVNYPSMLGAQS